jgi:poly-gamma-glutamate synthesis protein (capsule biosynthesis protein)
MRLLEPAGPVTMRVAAVGDIAVLSRTRERARRDGFDTPLAALAPALRAADWGFANLEFPVAEPGWVRPGRAAEFHHDPELAPALARAGVRVVSLANNHLMDCGERGLIRTLETCRAAGLEAIGAGTCLEEARRPASFESAGRRVRVLAYATPSENAATASRAGFAPLEESVVRADLERWRGEAEVLVVSAHWGSMYVDYPPPRVIEWAERLESWGADLVLGHHPHVLQGFRRRGRALILFSLGDGVFDPAAGDFEATIAGASRRESAVFIALLGQGPGLDCVPLILDGDGVPGLAQGAEGAAIAARLQRLSAGLEDAAARFAAESAPQLLRYELQSLGTYIRQRRFGRVAALLGSVRPRHLPLLWNAVRRMGRSR